MRRRKLQQISFSLLIFFALPGSTLSQTNSSECPLDFSVLRNFVSASTVPTNTSSLCAFSVQALHLVLAQYLLTSSRFLPPAPSASSCWSHFQSFLSPFLPADADFSLPSSCGFRPEWISAGCMSITTRSAFESAVPPSARDDMAANCNQSLVAVPSCTACTTSLNRVKAAYLPGPAVGNVTKCADYPFIYAAAVSNPSGPSAPGTAFCLFFLDSAPSGPPSPSAGSRNWIYGVVVGCVALLLLAAVAAWLFSRRRGRRRRRRRMDAEAPSAGSRALESIGASTTLVKYAFDDIKAATGNFSRDRLVGRGGYGNVYCGVLPDGSAVAIKRFKNCSAAGDASFAHEVEVIASVRHVNLLALRGYCIATTPMEGHQRMIVCDLVENGSLHDHLFGSPGESRLSWPLRQKIAVGMARGLAYLHYGAQPAIIHRDIKSSNILVDENFEAKLADFGLAKFAPEGMSHMSTRVAGTLGYVAPEYALYGQLTEKIDVYSFGVVLLELLSGRKAFVSLGEGQSFVLTDWAWSLVRQGRTFEVIQEGMEDMGPREVVEKYVLVAVLSTHPQLHARPTMDQIVKILETDLSVPTIPDRPIPIVASMEDIERSMSSSGSGGLTSFSGYQPFTNGADRVSSHSSEEEALS